MAVVFSTCLADIFAPDVPDRLVAALKAVGVPSARADGVTCCGQPGYSAGHHGAARRVARRSVRELAKTRGPIVLPAGSCAAMMKLHWPALFAGTRDEQAARAVAERVVEASQILASRRELIRSPLLLGQSSGRPLRVGYHDSCHLARELRVRSEPRLLLGAIDGVDVVDLEHGDRCCGFGGTFSIRYPEVSVAMADVKLREIEERDLDAVVSCDGGCLLQLKGRAGVRGTRAAFVHLVDLLYDAGLA